MTISLTELKTKLNAAQQNARQGEMGFPFAISKIPPIKEMVHSLAQNLVKQLEEANTINEDFKSQSE